MPPISTVIILNRKRRLLTTAAPPLGSAAVFLRNTKRLLLPTAAPPPRSEAGFVRSDIGLSCRSGSVERYAFLFAGVENGRWNRCRPRRTAAPVCEMDDVRPAHQPLVLRARRARPAGTVRAGDCADRCCLLPFVGDPGVAGIRRRGEAVRPTRRAGSRGRDRRPRP